jgi:CRP-like cAMP-binding protein
VISPELLRRFSSFVDVDEATLRKVAMISQEVRPAAGDTLFREGDKAENFYLILEGEIDLKYAVGGDEDRTVDTLVAGDLLVWSAMVEPYTCTASGVVRKNARLIAIDGKQLRGLCETNHDLDYSMLVALTSVLATRLEGARIQLATAD